MMWMFNTPPDDAAEQRTCRQPCLAASPLHLVRRSVWLRRSRRPSCDHLRWHGAVGTAGKRLTAPARPNPVLHTGHAVKAWRARSPISGAGGASVAAAAQRQGKGSQGRRVCDFVMAPATSASRRSLLRRTPLPNATFVLQRRARAPIEPLLEAWRRKSCRRVAPCAQVACSRCWARQTAACSPPPPLLAGAAAGRAAAHRP